jgi:hypothetical protein
MESKRLHNRRDPRSTLVRSTVGMHFKCASTRVLVGDEGYPHHKHHASTEGNENARRSHAEGSHLNSWAKVLFRTRQRSMRNRTPSAQLIRSPDHRGKL